MAEQGYVYIMANRRNGTIYIGATSNLAKRAWEHRNGVIPGFTKENGCTLLVWYEVHECLESARLRERRMKEWKRAWKLREIEGLNPEWEDLTIALRSRDCPAQLKLSPAKAGAQLPRIGCGIPASRVRRNWAPAFAGETQGYLTPLRSPKSPPWPSPSSSPPSR